MKKHWSKLVQIVQKQKNSTHALILFIETLIRIRDNKCKDDYSYSHGEFLFTRRLFISHRLQRLHRFFYFIADYNNGIQE